MNCSSRYHETYFNNTSAFHDRKDEKSGRWSRAICGPFDSAGTGGSRANAGTEIVATTLLVCARTVRLHVRALLAFIRTVDGKCWSTIAAISITPFKRVSHLTATRQAPGYVCNVLIPVGNTNGRNAPRAFLLSLEREAMAG
jgi:hypothetical protein